MKKILLMISYIILFILSIQSCKDKSTDPYEDILVKPIVEKTSTDYTPELFRSSFPKMELLHEIGEAYKNSYSEAVKNQLINYMKSQANKLGENSEIFNECMEVTGCNNSNSISLPSYAEKAKYEGKDVWIIQLVWGMMPSDLGHYKCFAISTDDKDTLDFKRCK